MGRRCPQCDHNSTYTRLKTKDIVCKQCGYSGSADAVISEKDKIRFASVKSGGCVLPPDAVPVSKEESLKRLDQEILKQYKIITPDTTSEP